MVTTLLVIKKQIPMLPFTENKNIKGLLVWNKKEEQAKKEPSSGVHHFAVMDLWRCEHEMRAHRIGRSKMMVGSIS